MGRHLEKMVAAGLLSLALLTCLTGCLQTTQTSPSSQPPQGETTSQASHTIPPEENRMFSVPNISWYSSQDGQGFYLPGSRLLSYYDPESQSETPLCAQSGCSHSDESCGAYLADDVQGFVTYQGHWYVLAVEGYSQAVLWQIDPQTHQRTKLCCISPQHNQEAYYFSSGFVSHGYAYLHLNHQLIWEEQVVEEPSLIRVNLTDGTVETLVKDVYVSFLGAGEDRVLLAVETFAVPPLSQEEYLSQHPDGNYYAYLQVQLAENGSGGMELREYTPDMSSYQVLTKGNVWVSSTPFLTRYGDHTLYAVDNTLYVYDLATGERREVVNEGILRNFMMIAGQIIYLTRSQGSSALAISYTDLAGGPAHRLANEGVEDGTVFSFSGECKDYIYGLYNGEHGDCQALLTKEDYFAQRYENIIPIS